MNIKQLAQKLRQAADVLDELTGGSVEQRRVGRVGRPPKDEQISNKLRKTWEIRQGASNKKGYKYNGKHWTQKPKNRARVLSILRRATRIKQSKVS